MTQIIDIELNDLFLKSLSLIENTAKNIFITGKAGTGKSTLLDYFRNTTKKKVVVLAPTGVAAINVKGETIHSFFGFKPDININKIRKIPDKHKNESRIYKKIDTIIIDEISMVRADLLDCVDKFLRLNGKTSKKPFGGVQMIFIGDLYQLPPVVAGKEKELFKTLYKSQYFFDAKVFEYLEMEYLELEKVYRQKDQDFIDLLNCFRNNSVEDSHLSIINSRHDENFEPNDDYFIYLTTTNLMADELNNKYLERLASAEMIFDAVIEGEVDKKHLPTSEHLKLKAGSQIMMLNNDSFGRWVNGTIGKIIELGKESIHIELQNGKVEEVTPFTWEIFHFSLNKNSFSLESEIVGSFMQFPMKLAWAITIHKSQGLTFDKVILDIGKGTFAHGQLYVALSRCRTFNGIILKKQIKKSHVWMDWRVRDFITKYQYKKAGEVCPADEKIKIIKDAISNKSKIEITYLKAKDEKSKRLISPFYIGDMEFKGKSYIGLKAYCHLRGEERVFNVNRILEISTISK